MLFAATLALFAAAAAAVPAGSSMVCNADNCLRAIRATKRPGAADCSSYFQTTITPAAVTSSVTSYIYVTNTATQDTTETDTIFQTQTDIEHTTITQTIPYTVTTQVTSYSAGIQKRQETAIPSDIPIYATACSGAVRYSSACSCLGVQATTITASGPTVITTVPVTLTVSTQTVITTVSTDYVTIVDATTVIIETDATATQSTPIATQTDVTYFDKFYIQIQDTSFAGKYLGNQQGVIGPVSADQTPAIFSIVNGVAVTSGQNISIFGSRYILGFPACQVVLPSSGLSSTLTYEDVQMVLDGNGVPKMSVADAGALKPWICVDVFVVSLPNVSVIILLGKTCVQVSIKAVPVF
ncbi:hypothetical protein TWF694_008917 [Orbilia ellipsospora]|uniref:Uncharacterized protein n=1 Tax=Orbilia ellipsospora TaxID=2528407 RepID=A0AAV9XER2_9PEZI